MRKMLGELHFIRRPADHIGSNAWSCIYDSKAVPREFKSALPGKYVSANAFSYALND